MPRDHVEFEGNSEILGSIDEELVHSDVPIEMKKMK